MDGDGDVEMGMVPDGCCAGAAADCAGGTELEGAGALAAEVSAAGAGEAAGAAAAAGADSTGAGAGAGTAAGFFIWIRQW